MSWSGTTVSSVVVLGTTEPGGIVASDASVLDVTGRALTVPVTTTPPEGVLSKSFIDAYRGPAGPDGPVGGAGPAAGNFNLASTETAGSPTGTGATSTITNYTLSSYRVGRLLRVQLHAVGNRPSSTATASTVVLPFPSALTIAPTDILSINAVSSLNAAVPGASADNYISALAVTSIAVDNTNKRVTVGYTLGVNPTSFSGNFYLDLEVVLTVA
jgi:hypothetical protein